MNITQCATFVAVVDTGSFTNAAKVRQVSQSAVSHAIASLEAELGVPLMVRDRSGVELTTIGRRLLDHARSVTVHAEMMRQEAANAKCDRLTGTLRIGASRSLAHRLLVRTMTRFQSRFPGFEMRLREGTDVEISDWICAGELDVGIVTPPRRQMTTVPLLEEEVHAALPRGHGLAAQPALRVEQIFSERLIMPADNDRSIMRTVLGEADREPTVAYRVQDLNVLLSLVAEGHGIALLPQLALPAKPQDVRIMSFSPPVTRRLVLALSVNARETPAAKTFVSMAKDLARNTAPPPRPARIA